MAENEPSEMLGWTAVGVVAEMQPITIGGVNAWDREWKSIDRPVTLPHPIYLSQHHEFSVYRIDADGRDIVFAAGELSPCVWGFYVPVGKTVPPATR
jgi:hypothetical protein